MTSMELIGIFMLSILITGILGLIIWVGVILSDTIFSSIKNVMKFDSFVSFYNINSRVWYLYDSTVEYSRNQAEYRFSFADCIKYKIWKYKCEKVRKQKKDAEQYQQTLEFIKHDLEEFNRKNEKTLRQEIEEYNRKVEKIF